MSHQTINAERFRSYQRSRHFEEKDYWENMWRQKEDLEFLRSHGTQLFVHFPTPDREGSSDPTFQSVIKKIASELCDEHRFISIDADMLGGMPHVAGLRLSVGDVLAKLYRYGDIQKIVEVYKPDLTEDHVKEAIAYAQDFLEEVYVHGES